VDTDIVPATNWAGNVTFRAERRERPADLDALRRVVATARRVRVLGTGHSFNRIADTAGVLVSLAGLPRSIDVDADRRVVEIAGQWTYGELAGELHRSGLALPNTGSLPHISVAGACSTGTHGSGVGNQALGASVCAATVLTASGDVVRVDRDDPDFDGWVLALGRLGVVVALALDVVPTFDVGQTVVDRVPDAHIGSALADVLAAAYSVSVFTTWGPERVSQVWVKELAGQPLPGERWGGTDADGPRHPVAGMPVEFATEQLGVPGPWHQRLPHFRLDFVPSSGDELQSEYLVPMTHAGDAWRAVDAIRDVVHPLLHVSELRAVAADPMWLGLTGGQLSLAVHFTWRPGPGVAHAVAAVEQQLAPYDARPHWGKVFSVPPHRLESLYPRLPDFRRHVQAVDPDGTFGSDLVDGWIGLS
jgi:xylitol oxidase